MKRMVIEQHEQSLHFASRIDEYIIGVCFLVLAVIKRRYQSVVFGHWAILIPVAESNLTL